MQLYLTVRPEDMRTASVYPVGLAHAAYRIGEGSSLLSRNLLMSARPGPMVPLPGLLVLSDRAAPPIDRPAALTEAVFRECARRSYGGIVLDFDEPPQEDRRRFAALLGQQCAKSRKFFCLPPSYAAAVESEVLLKNEGNILPLEYGRKILVTGPNANSMRALNGGWSYTWQGDADRFAGDFNTIYEALAQKFGEKNVIFEPGVVYDETDRWATGAWQKEYAPQIAKAVAAASKVDVIVACVGENSYCETPGNIDDLNLSANQKELVKALSKTGKPIILVLNEGRPRVLREIEPLAKAVVDVMLPGNYGGDALAALMSGEENFSGKLPFTYPKYVNSLHTYDYKVSESRETMAGEYNYDAVMDVQWPFGYGLSYTTFEYSEFKCLNGSEFAAGDDLKFEVTVANTGSHNGKEAVLLYSSDIVASMIPDVKRLREFAKVELAPGESKVVSFTVPAKELAFVGADGKWRLEAGDFRMSCGGQSLMITCNETKIWDTRN